MPRPSMPRWIALIALAAASQLGAAGRADAADGRDLAAATEQCKKASDKQAVIASCSAVIAQSHDPRLLERAYNRRGRCHVNSFYLSRALERRGLRRANSRR